MAADSRVIFSTELDESGLRNGLDKLGGTIKKLAFGAAGIGALHAIGSALKSVATNAMNYNSQMEQYATSFSTLLGSQEAAAKKIAYLKDFAAKTPFEMTDLADSQKTLLGFGVATEKADWAMEKLGDISQGNSQQFSQLSLVYGQMASTGKLMGQDLLQMINAGFNPLTAIAEKTGVKIGDLKQVMAGGKTSDAFKAQMKSAQDEVKKLGENASEGAKMLAQIGAEGQISADLVDQSINIATSAGGRFYQAMDKQSKTAAGMISTLKDNYNAMTGELFSSVSEAAKDEALPAALGYVDTLTAALKERGAAGMMEALGGVMGDIASRASSFAPQVVKIAVNLLKAFVSGIKANVQVIAKGLSDTLVAAAKGIMETLPDILDVLVSLAIELVSGLADALPEIIPELVDAALDLMIKLLTNVPRLIEAGLKIAAGLVAGVIQGINSLVGGIADLFATNTADKMQNAVNGIKANVKPTVSAESKQNITDAINEGIAAADSEHDITVTINGEIGGIREQQDSIFADGADSKLSKKEATGLTKALNTQVDNAIKEATEHIEEKKKEYETSLAGLVDASGLPLLDKSEITELSAAIGAEVTTMTEQLDTTRDQYNALLKTIRDNGGTWTAQQILELNTLLTKIAEIEGKLKILNDETAQAGEAKVGRVKRGTGTEEDFNYSLGYEKQKYTNKVADIDEATNATLAANQTTIDTATAQIETAKKVLTNINATDKEIAKAQLVINANQALIDSATAAIDAASSAGEQSKSDALANFNAEITALYDGMAKANPDAAAAISNMAKLAETYEKLSPLFSKNSTRKGLSKEEYATILTPENLKHYLGIDKTPEQLTAMLGDTTKYGDTLRGLVDDIFVSFSKESGTAAEGLKDNPMSTYIQTMIDSGTFDTLDLTKLSGGISTAFQAAAFSEAIKGNGAYIVDGTVEGINTRSGELTAEDMATLKNAFLSKIKSAFGIESPAKTMHPVGENITSGIGVGMTDDTAKASMGTYAATAKGMWKTAFDEAEPNMSESGEAIVDGIGEGIDSNNNTIGPKLKTAVTTGVKSAGASGKKQGYNVGEQIMAGIAQGVEDNADKLRKALLHAIPAALLALMAFLNINSPSRYTRDKIGKPMAEGIGVGVEDGMRFATKGMIQSIADSVAAGKSVLDNTLVAKVSRYTGIPLPTSGIVANSIMSGSALAASAGVTNSSSQTTIDARQYVTFAQPMQAPDEIARAIRKQRTYGLAGVKA